jgi:hypothetical protein
VADAGGLWVPRVWMRMRVFSVKLGPNQKWYAFNHELELGPNLISQFDFSPTQCRISFYLLIPFWLQCEY